MRDLNKKGQLTIFIILAIVIIGLIFLLFVFRDKIGLSSEASIDEKEMISSIEGCVSESLVDGTRLIGLQGGYLELPEKVVELNLSKVAYGYYLGEDNLNSKSRIENEISNYIELMLPYCFDESQFLEYSITKGDIDSKVEINGRGVSTSTRFSIGASKGDSSFTIDKKFNAEVPIKLNSIYDTVNAEIPIKINYIYDTAEENINKEIENPNAIELTYLADLDYSVSIIPYDDNIIIYSISDENLKDPDYHYTFMFANRLK